MKSANHEQQWTAVKDIIPRGKPGEWKKAIETMIADSHDLAIVTKSSFPDIVRRYMLEQVGISEETLKKLYFDCASSINKEPGKNGHIKRAKEHFGRSENDTNVILVEDDKSNLKTAQEAKLLHPSLGTVLAPTEDADEGSDGISYVTAPHIKELLNNIQQLAPKSSERKKSHYDRGFYSTTSSPLKSDNLAKPLLTGQKDEEDKDYCPCRIL